MITLTCGGCGKGYRVGDESAGKRTRCKGCGQVMTIPAVAAAPPAPVVAAPPPLPVPVETVDGGDDDWGMGGGTGEVFQPAAAPPPMRRGTSINDLRRTGPGPTKRPARSGMGLGFRFDWGSRILLILGIVGLVFGIQEWRLSGIAADQPQSITCQALSGNGPGTNAHVHLTDFVALSNYVHKSENNATLWSEVFIPLYPISDLSPARQKMARKQRYIQSNEVDSTKVHIVLKSSHVTDEAGLLALIHHDTIDGMIVNKIASLSTKENQLLTEHYPTMDVPDAYILEEGREPRGGLGGLLTIVGGLLILGAIANTLRPR